MAFNDFKKLRDAGFENFKILASVIRDGDFGEHVDRISEAAAVDPGAVSRNKTHRFQSFDPLQAGLCDNPTASASAALVMRPFYWSSENNLRSMRSSFGIVVIVPIILSLSTIQL